MNAATKLRLRGSLSLISAYSISISILLSLKWVGWALIRGWAPINFFSLWDGRLIEVGANSRLGAYSNKYGTPWAGIETLDLVEDHLGTLKW